MRRRTRFALPSARPVFRSLALPLAALLATAAVAAAPAPPAPAPPAAAPTAAPATKVAATGAPAPNATAAAPPSAAAVARAPAVARPQFSADECVVFERELGFARSVAEHDAAAFAEHVHDYAAFSASRAHPLRGRTAIVRGWDGILRGTAVVLSWYPTRVTMGQGDGAPATVAWSSGPALFENPDPAASDRYALGEFHSVWHKGDDGQWRVLFDDGVAPRPATAAQVAAFRAARPAACPRS